MYILGIGFACCLAGMAPLQWQICRHTESSFAELTTFIEKRFILEEVNPAAWTVAPRNLATALSRVAKGDTFISFRNQYECRLWTLRSGCIECGEFSVIILSHAIFPEALIAKRLFSVGVTPFFKYLNHSSNVVSARCMVKHGFCQLAFNLQLQPTDSPQFAADMVAFVLRHQGYTDPEMALLSVSLPNGEPLASQDDPTVQHLIARLTAELNNAIELPVDSDGDCTDTSPCDIDEGSR